MTTVPDLVVTAGADLLADAVADQAVDVERVDWRPPMPGTAPDLAVVAADPRRRTANQRALAAVLEKAVGERTGKVELAKVDTDANPRLAQAFGRLIRSAEDRGHFVVLSAAFPSRLLSAFPPGTPVRRVTLEEALQRLSGGVSEGDGAAPSALRARCEEQP